MPFLALTTLECEAVMARRPVTALPRFARLTWRPSDEGSLFGSLLAAEGDPTAIVMTSTLVRIVLTV
jgi:hypothetical protein